MTIERGITAEGDFYTVERGQYHNPVRVDVNGWEQQILEVCRYTYDDEYIRCKDGELIIAQPPRCQNHWYRHLFPQPPT